MVSGWDADVGSDGYGLVVSAEIDDGDGLGVGGAVGYPDFVLVGVVEAVDDVVVAVFAPEVGVGVRPSCEVLGWAFSGGVFDAVGGLEAVG